MTQNNALKKIKKEGKSGINKIRILHYLFKLGKASVHQVCTAIQLSAPTTLALLSELVNDSWVEKKGLGNSNGGRKPDLFGMAAGKFYILCINIELFTVHISLFDNTLAPQGKTVAIPYSLSKDRESFQSVLKQAKELVKNSNIPQEKLAGVSMCLPGLTNPETGENFGYLTDNNDTRPLRDYCAAFFKVPVIIQNDVNAAALSELHCGKAKGKKNALVLLMDWGVGLGIIMDGEVRKGASGFSGEIGHIPFEDNGALCYCGKHGCLETVASGVALAKMAKEGIAAGQHSILKELSNQELEKIEPRLIVEAANKGDLFAIKLLSNVGSNIGKSISTLIQIFNPELIIMEGRIAAAGEYITLPMLQSINTYCMLQIREKTEIVSSDLGISANLLGCAVEGVNHFFEEHTK
ncbi:ROK family protein [Niabella soli]|uniref:Glucokinase n=1 Tax=Niabella soli DSM 19437 TaxID=929713 RepID=W0EUH2_9BACT|nr:ROK family protein [Niabella soli]AHF14437.1 glucokinase [Niabella soli DSM 19437]